MTFTIPGEPVPKGRPRVTLRGGRPRAYTPAKTTEYERRVRLAAAVARVPMLVGAVGLDVVARWPYPAGWTVRRRAASLESEHLGRLVLKESRPDVDNVAKSVMDAMQGVAFADDNQVACLRVAKAWGPVAETHVRLWQGDAPEWPEAWWMDAARVRREVA